MKEELFRLFTQIEWMMRWGSQRERRNLGPMGDPRRGQGRILALLKLNPGISQKDLAFLLDIRPQSLGELLAKLERGGYIKRAPSQKDRRVMEVCLTEEGVKQAGSEPEQDDPFGCLRKEEQEILRGYLRRIVESMREQIDTDREGRVWQAERLERLVKGHRLEQGR